MIGVHTRCIIVCVVFSKKCSVCENRKNKVSIKEDFPITTPTSPFETINDPYVSTIQPNISAYIVEETVANDGIVNNSDTGIIDVGKVDHPCTRNYDGSSEGMESDCLLLLMKKIQKKYNGEIFL